MNLPESHSFPAGNFNPVDAPSYEQLVHCMRCGLCLAACPTYSLYQQEKASPRGRLALMRAVSERHMDITDGFADAMTLCLGCLACQTACPAGVPFGNLLERARRQAEAHQKQSRSPLVEKARNWMINKLVYGPHGIEPLLPFIHLYQRMGLPHLNMARLLPGPFGSWERLLPQVQAMSAHQTLGEFVPAVPPIRGRVGLLTGCLENTLLARMCTATARILSYNGFEVVIPQIQVCCGALPAHIGELDVARQQARQNIDVFSEAGVEIVISDAAGCSAQLKEYGHLLKEDPLYRERAQQFSANSRDATEFLAEHAPLRKGMRSLNLRVAYDDPCHLIHAQGIYIQPRELLRDIPGLELVDLPESSWCCGSAGTYNLTHTIEAGALLKRKMDHLRSLSVDVLATANTGCYIQLAAGVREHGLNVLVTHVVELIAQAYGLQEMTA
jgi:glycolate oxidase iron-sulfur subunit